MATQALHQATLAAAHLITLWVELALLFSVSSVAHIGPPPKVIVVELAIGGVSS
jgi:hypothetical protein